MSQLELLAPEAERPPPPPIDRPTAQTLHALLDRLEDAAGFAAAALTQVRQYADRLLGMQTLAEAVAEQPGTEEDRETAGAKIELLAQQLDVIARRSVFEEVPVLEGGRFRFELAAGLEDFPDALALDVPNLRPRGEGSLELLQHIDDYVGVVGAGGAVSLALATDVAEDALDEAGAPLALEFLPPGRYRLELTYLALDASDVRVRLLPEGDGPPVREFRGVDLSPDPLPAEVDLGVGMALIVQRLPAAAEAEIESSTVQTVEWRHETGERLRCGQGWFHETVKPADFEAYALHLEEPREVVQGLLDRLEAFGETVEALLERVADRIGDEEDEGTIQASLHLSAPGWSLFDRGGLLEALTAEEV